MSSRRLYSPSFFPEVDELHEPLSPGHDLGGGRFMTTDQAADIDEATDDRAEELLHLCLVSTRH